MGGKFTTTNSNLFNNNNKNQVPDWMSNLTENLKMKDHHVELETEKPRGAFASSMPVYRPDGDASLRPMEQSYSETKLVADSKVQLARFLTGKYYRIKNAHAGINNVTLDVSFDGVGAQFQFPFEVKNSKLKQASSFFVNEGEYPFSKPGLEESLLDIKNNKTKAPKVVEAVGKVFVINREEIVRRFNGSLRQATDRINSLLNEGVIVGADSNRYATHYDVDQLFPQMTKEAAEERMAEFHFAPNQEHIATNEYKHANVLSVEASKILRENFADFAIKSSSRTQDELVVKAAVLNASNNVRSEIDFTFSIIDEKVAGVKLASVGNKVMNFNDLISNLNSTTNTLSQWQKVAGSNGKRLYDKAVFNTSDVKERLNKVINASKIERVIDSWVAKGLVNQINSNTFTTELSFEDLLSKTVVANVLSDDEVAEIEAYQRHFGDGLDFQRDEKEVLKRVREASDAEVSNQFRLNHLQSTLAKQFKNFQITAFKNDGNDSYSASLTFTHNGVRNGVNVVADFSDGLSVIASVDGKNYTIDRLAEAFEKSPILAAYLSDGKSASTVNSIVFDMDSVRRTLANLASSGEIDKAIDTWLNYNLIVNVGENRYASKHSFEELLQISNITAISESELSNRIARQKRDRGMEVTSAHVNNTGERQLEETWSPERMSLHASSKIGSMFRQYELLDVSLSDDSYTVTARVVNPKNGLKQKLDFKFAMVNGLPKELAKVANDKGEVVASQVDSVLNDGDEAVKQFIEANKFDGANYRNVINRGRLENQLKTIANASDVAGIVNHLVEANILKAIGLDEFASESTMPEIVAYLSSQAKTNVEAAKDQRTLANRDEHKLDLTGQHLKDTDNRALEAKETELSPQMMKVRDKLSQVVLMAQKAKKITANKSNQLQTLLSTAKTEKELDSVSKELNRYI